MKGDISKLTEESTPCEICRELGLIDERIAVKPKSFMTREDLGNNICYGSSVYAYGFNSCLQKDRAMIKLLFLNLRKGT